MSVRLARRRSGGGCVCPRVVVRCGSVSVAARVGGASARCGYGVCCSRDFHLRQAGGRVDTFMARQDLLGRAAATINRRGKICVCVPAQRPSAAPAHMHRSRCEFERTREPSELLTRPPSPIILHYATRDLVVLYPNATGVSAIVCGVLSGPRSRSQSHVSRL